MEVDENELEIEFEVINKKYRHLGLLGKARDFITEIPNTLHILEEISTKEKFCMQNYQNLSSDILTIKLK
jgi:hypothetical protein